MRVLQFFMLSLSCLFLLGCKVELYSNMEERAANSMMTSLLAHGIDVQKVAAKKEKWTLMVEKQELPRAMMLLEKQGLPRPRYATIPEVFGSQGMITSRLVEQAKYVYALSQEVASTISHMDGVLTASVHLVLPKINETTEKIIPSSASVFVKYKPDSDVPARVHDIRKFVQYSIPELAYDKISAFLFPADQDFSFISSVPKYDDVLGLKLRPGEGPIGWLVIGLCCLQFLIIVFLIFLMVRRSRRKNVAN